MSYSCKFLFYSAICILYIKVNNYILFHFTENLNKSFHLYIMLFKDFCLSKFLYIRDVSSSNIYNYITLSREVYNMMIANQR